MPSDQPQISYIVTVYNKAEFLPVVARSLQAQKGLGEVEAIFVDDGSTDDSPKVLQEIVAKWPAARLVRQENSGPAPATNAGICAARGQWIKVMDGDDILHEDATRSLLDAAGKYDTRFAYGQISLIPWRDGEPQVPENPPSPLNATPLHETRPLEKFAHNMTFNPTCVLIDTELAKEMGGVESRVFAQDYSMFLRAAHRTAFAFVPCDICWAPGAGDAEGRVSDDEAQILHDLNAELAYFAAETPDLDPDIMRTMLKRGTGRAWKWAKRKGGHNILSQYFRDFLMSRLPTSRDQAIARLARSPHIFRETSAIRVPFEKDGRVGYKRMPPGKP